ncbi:MAG: sigma-70 family RNA polymerase sigma factor [Flavobacteriales bacterium]|nr:sigma-70 family RNA polymerase sigma factor [Flavobacteriales bacterium]
MRQRSLSLSDQDLILAILEHPSEEIYHIIHQRYFRKVYYKCLQMIRNESVAADVTQEIFIKAFTKLSSFKHQSSFSTWLYSITNNECIDYLRKHKREKSRYAIESGTPVNLFENLLEETDEELDEYSVDQLEEAMHLLNENDKQLLFMKYFMKLPVKTIVAQTGLTESAVKMRLKRAKEKLFGVYLNSVKKSA